MMHFYCPSRPVCGACGSPSKLAYLLFKMVNTQTQPQSEFHCLSPFTRGAVAPREVTSAPGPQHSRPEQGVVLAQLQAASPSVLL